MHTLVRVGLPIPTIAAMSDTGTGPQYTTQLPTPGAGVPGGPVGPTPPPPPTPGGDDGGGGGGRTILWFGIGALVLSLLGLGWALLQSGGSESAGEDTTTTTSSSTTTTTTTPTSTSPSTTTTSTTTTTTTTPSTTTTTEPEQPPRLVFDAVWSSEVDANGESVTPVLAAPSGSTDLCLTWSHQGIAEGTAWELIWHVDGVEDPNVGSTGTIAGPDRFFACITNANGLADGAYEVTWLLDGELLFGAAAYVGGARAPVDVTFFNDTAADVCAIQINPDASTTWGIDRARPRHPHAEPVAHRADRDRQLRHPCGRLRR